MYPALTATVKQIKMIHKMFFALLRFLNNMSIPKPAFTNKPSEMAVISDIADCWLMDGVPMTNPPDYTDGVFKVFNTALTGNELRLATPDVLYDHGLAFKECQTIVSLS